MIGVGRAVNDVTLGMEAWSSSDLDPAGSSQQYSLDFDVAWQPDGDTQLDGGIDVGMNHQTPGAQVYMGVSRRF